MNIQINEIAPFFLSLDQHGQKHQLSDYQGQWLVLYFYPKDNTPGCTKEACSFRDSLGELKKQAQILGVSGDSQESHLKFSEKFSLNFPLLSDPDKQIIQAYQADGVILPKRVTFLINPQGKIAKIYQKVNVNEHANQILKDLKDLS